MGLNALKDIFFYFKDIFTALKDILVLPKDVYSPIMTPQTTFNTIFSHFRLYFCNFAAHIE